MLASWYDYLGITGTVILGVLMALTAITWVAAVSGVVTSNWSLGKKLVMQSLLVLLPPVSLVYVGAFVVANHRSIKKANRL